jgi:GntR family transcriptional repressor for pyruvate dehydrogenase complex
MEIGPAARTSDDTRGGGRPRASLAADLVIAYVHHLIETGQCRPGDRIPPERELAGLIGVSRPSVRTGLQALAALGVIEARRGSGTFITHNPPCFARGSLRFFAALHGISREQLFEVRRILEMDMAELAAERASGAQLAAISEEVMEMFAVHEDPEQFLVHDIRFHHAVSRAAGNPVLGALAEMVAEVFFERRRESVFPWQDAAAAADHHKRIYQAIRDQDRERARREMSTHMTWAGQVQALEAGAIGGPGRMPFDRKRDEP